MAKHIINKFVRFAEFLDLSGTPIDDWHREYLGLKGMLCIYESEHKAPGKRFVYFYPSEPYSLIQKHFNSTPGDLIESEGKIFLTTNHKYVFEVSDHMTKEEKATLWLNVFARV